MPGRRRLFVSRREEICRQARAPARPRARVFRSRNFRHAPRRQPRWMGVGAVHFSSPTAIGRSWATEPFESFAACRIDCGPCGPRDVCSPASVRSDCGMIRFRRETGRIRCPQRVVPSFDERPHRQTHDGVRQVARMWMRPVNLCRAGSGQSVLSVRVVRTRRCSRPKPASRLFGARKDRS